MASRIPTHGTIAWLDLSTPEVDPVAEFYSRLFRWDLESEDTPMGRYVIGSVGGNPTAGMMAPPPEAAGMPPAWTVYFAVDDIDAAFARACAEGGTSLQDPIEIPGGDRLAALLDPLGAAFGLMQPVPGNAIATEYPGATCWAETSTRDVAATRSYYEKVLGWTAREGDGGYWLFDMAEEEIAGMMAIPGEVPAEVPNYWLVYFAVSRVAQTLEAATGLGATVIVPDTDIGGGMRFGVLQDPAGAAFGVLQQS